MSKGGTIGYIVQEEMPLDVDTEIKVLEAMGRGAKFNAPVPPTVAVYNYDWIKRYSLSHLLGEQDSEVAKRLRVPDDVVRNWALKEGDKIVFDPKEGFRGIISVNGFTNPGAVSKRPKLVTEIHSDYAARRIPIESVVLEPPVKPGAPDGNFVIRLYTLLAPIPEGGRVFFAAPAEAGKSTTLLFVYEALLKLLQKDEQLFIIALQVGERPEDATRMQNVYEKVEHDRKRSEIYLAPVGDPRLELREGHYRMAKWVKSRSERLCEGTKDFGYRVVLIIDSISRVMMSHTASDKIEKQKNVGLLSQGLHYSSLTATQDILHIAGNFGDRSLTVLGTALKEDISTKNRVRAAENEFYKQSVPSLATTRWEAEKFFDEDLRPNVGINNTFTRNYHEICTTGQLEERKYVLDMIWSPTSGYSSSKGIKEVLRELFGYVKKNPRYENTKFAALDKETGGIAKKED
jgi:transcription termination factor Rho